MKRVIEHLIQRRDLSTIRSIFAFVRIPDIRQALTGISMDVFADRMNDMAIFPLLLIPVHLCPEDHFISSALRGETMNGIPDSPDIVRMGVVQRVLI